MWRRFKSVDICNWNHNNNDNWHPRRCTKVDKPFVYKWQLGEKRRSISTHSSLLSFVTPVGSGCPPQMIELIYNYERFASSIYLLCPDEQSIPLPPVFSKHHECIIAGNLLPTSNRHPDPGTCNTTLTSCCLNTTTSLSPSAQHSWVVVHSLNWLCETEISSQHDRLHV